MFRRTSPSLVCQQVRSLLGVSGGSDCSAVASKNDPNKVTHTHTHKHTHTHHCHSDGVGFFAGAGLDAVPHHP